MQKKLPANLFNKQPYTLIIYVSLSIAAPNMVGCGTTLDANEKQISLNEIYATTEQKDLKRVGKFLKKGARRVLNEDICKVTSGFGASNIFLVRGENIDQAINSTGMVFCGARSTDRSVHPGDKVIPKKHWLVVYFGTGGTALRWKIKTVVRKAVSIEVHGRQLNPTTDTRIIRQHFIWAPLGELEPDTYFLRLVDHNTLQTVLSRRVKVSGK